MSACPVDIAHAERWTSTGRRVSPCPIDIADAERCDAAVIVKIGIVPQGDTCVRDVGGGLTALGLDEEEDEESENA